MICILDKFQNGPYRGCFVTAKNPTENVCDVYLKIIQKHHLSFIHCHVCNEDLCNDDEYRLL